MSKMFSGPVDDELETIARHSVASRFEGRGSPHLAAAIRAGRGGHDDQTARDLQLARVVAYQTKCAIMERLARPPVIPIGWSPELRDAIKNAEPGQTIEIDPITYKLIERTNDDD